MFLLRPDPVVEQIYLYCLGLAAARFGITLHAWILLSNHHHVLFRDNRGNFPDFLQYLHSLTARAINHHLRRRENLWSSDQASVVWTVESTDRFGKLLYLLANPVAADLVDRVADWPGVCSLAQVLSGEPLRIKRPKFFREKGKMPAEVELRAERIESYTEMAPREWRERILTELARLETKARDKRRAENRRVMGRKNVLRAPLDTRPATPEPLGRRRPYIACKNRGRRELELDRLRAFRISYYAALDIWRSGDHSVVFPEGTFRMRWFGARTLETAA